MSRIDFRWCIFENVEELLLSVFLRAWAWACIRSLYLCIHGSILAYTNMFLRFCVSGNGPTYTGSCLYVWALTHVCEMLERSPTLPIFTHFSTVSPPYAILKPFFFLIILVFKCHCIILFISTHASRHYIPWISLGHESNDIFFLQSSSPYASRGSTNKVVEWFKLLFPETRGYIREAGFEPVISFLPKKTASATLAQCLIERW